VEEKKTKTTKAIEKKAKKIKLYIIMLTNRKLIHLFSALFAFIAFLICIYQIIYKLIDPAKVIVFLSFSLFLTNIGFLLTNFK